MMLFCFTRNNDATLGWLCVNREGGVMKQKRRALTSIELENLDRFKNIWQEKKQALGLTQEQAGLACGWNGQSAFSQFFGGIVPLNVEAVLRLAKVLKIHPAEIMPDIVDLLPEGYGDTTAVTPQDQDALALVQLIMELPPERRVVLRQVAETIVDTTPQHEKEMG